MLNVIGNRDNKGVQRIRIKVNIYYLIEAAGAKGNMQVDSVNVFAEYFGGTARWWRWCESWQYLHPGRAILSSPICSSSQWLQRAA